MVSLLVLLATRWWLRLAVLQKASEKAVKHQCLLRFGSVDTLDYEGGPIAVGASARGTQADLSSGFIQIPPTPAGQVEFQFLWAGSLSLRF